MRRGLPPLLLLLAVWPLGAASAAPPPYVEPGLRLKPMLEIGAQFFPGAASTLVGTGITYGLVVGWQPFWFLGAEAAYEGATYRTLEEPDGPTVSIYENGAQLALKVSPNFGRLEPYALAGVGFSTISESSDQVFTGIIKEDTVFKLPIGVGLDIHMSNPREPTVPHLVVGIRGVYRFVLDQAFLAVSERGADQITVTALIGMQL